MDEEVTCFGVSDAFLVANLRVDLLSTLVDHNNLALPGHYTTWNDCS